MFKKTIAAAAAVIAMAGSANALVVGITGAGLEIGAPAVVDNDAPANNDFIQVFNEVQNFILGSTLFTDTGSISAGTAISSHMVFLNKVTGTSGTVSKSADFTFDGMILGTMSSRHGELQYDSDYLGVGIDYSHFGPTFTARGIEGADAFSVSGDTFSATLLQVTQPGDWIRVVTVAAIPLPATILLLPMGFGALTLLRRRRKRTDA